jgi:hypothetical protein
LLTPLDEAFSFYNEISSSAMAYLPWSCYAFGYSDGNIVIARHIEKSQ